MRMERNKATGPILMKSMKIHDVTISGEYRNGLRIGMWKTSYKGNEIGGGNYDENGKKQGNWIEIQHEYIDDCRKTISLEYRNGLPIPFFSQRPIGQPKSLRNRSDLNFFDNNRRPCKIDQPTEGTAKTHFYPPDLQWWFPPEKWIDKNDVETSPREQFNFQWFNELLKTRIE